MSSINKINKLVFQWMKSKWRSPGLILGIILCLNFFILAGSGDLLEFEFEEYPAPSHSEKGVPRAYLVLEKIIKPDFDNDLFMAKPTALTVDDEGSIYVYDQILRRIYKFDAQYRYMGHFLKEGRGPGEILALDSGFHKLYYSENGNLYVCDSPSWKIIAFSKEGKYINDIQMNEDLFNSYRPFSPVVDKKGNYYFLGDKKSILYQTDSRMHLLHSYLNVEYNSRFVVFKPSTNTKVPNWLWLQPDNENTYYDITPDEYLVIYLSRPSTIFVFRNKTLIRQFNVLLEEPMNRFRDSMADSEAMMKKHKKLVAIFGNMFNSFFVDKDQKSLIYFSDYNDQSKPRLYQFNLEGKLTKIFVTREKPKCYILAKRNNLFYGLSFTEGHIYIFKEEVKK